MCSLCFRSDFGLRGKGAVGLRDVFSTVLLQNLQCQTPPFHGGFVVTAETSSLSVLNASVGESIVTTAKTSSLSARNVSVRGNIATTAETSSLLAPNASVPLRHCYDCSDIITVLAKRFRFAECFSPVYIGKELFAMSSFQVARPSSTGLLRPRRGNKLTLNSSRAHWLHTLKC